MFSSQVATGKDTEERCARLMIVKRSLRSALSAERSPLRDLPSKRSTLLRSVALVTKTTTLTWVEEQSMRLARHLSNTTHLLTIHMDLSTGVKHQDKEPSTEETCLQLSVTTVAASTSQSTAIRDSHQGSRKSDDHDGQTQTTTCDSRLV